jgi:hypothetical protein
MVGCASGIQAAPHSRTTAPNLISRAKPNRSSYSSDILSGLLEPVSNDRRDGELTE